MNPMTISRRIFAAAVAALASTPSIAQVPDGGSEG
jgi:hypothetical protein